MTSKEEDKPVDIAIQGMERALMKISETGNVLKNARMEISEKIVSQNDQLFAELIGFLNKDDFGDVKWIQTQLKVRDVGSRQSTAKVCY